MIDHRREPNYAIVWDQSENQIALATINGHLSILRDLAAVFLVQVVSRIFRFNFHGLLDLLFTVRKCTVDIYTVIW